ncbi:MAG: hypothetical protein ABID54_00025 [Pseudomonadota bacterium]
MMQRVAGLSAQPIENTVNNNHLTNSPEYAINYGDAFNVGAVVIPLDTRLKSTPSTQTIRRFSDIYEQETLC